MPNVKNWWQSQTIWSQILQVVLLIAVTFGFVSQDLATAIQTDLSAAIAQIVSAGLAIWGIYGRVVAKSSVGSGS